MVNSLDGLDTCIDLYLYIFPPLFLCFCLKILLNVNFKMKKGLWAAKAIVHTSIWLGKMESDILNLNVWCLKSQRLTLNVKISKISSTDLKNEMYYSKRSNVMICVETKWKASKICNNFLVGGHICSFL